LESGREACDDAAAHKQGKREVFPPFFLNAQVCRQTKANQRDDIRAVQGPPQMIGIVIHATYDPIPLD
jgi:hypothetical protein